MLQYFLRHLFFFSSRRRHTRLVSDWSSDVCSSDLSRARSPAPKFHAPQTIERGSLSPTSTFVSCSRSAFGCFSASRSEERRVGKECRSRGSEEPKKIKYRQDGERRSLSKQKQER